MAAAHAGEGCNAAGSRPRVLCVDDEIEILDILADYLTAEGFAVRTATSADRAVLEAKRWTPKALIVDLVMPRVGGLDTIERIRRVNPGIAVILMSGRLDVGAAAARVGVPVVAAVPKPIDLVRVRAALVDAGAIPGSSGAVGPGGSIRAGLRVLIVEDDPDIGELLTEYLTSQGVDARAVTSGEAAIEEVQEWHPEIVLLDIVMPGLGGMETLRRIRALSSETSVVMLSGSDDPQQAQAALALGAIEYVPKPVDFGYLDSILAAHGAEHATTARSR